MEQNKRSFLFRDVAIEFSFADKRNFLCVFGSKKERQAALHKLATKSDTSAMKQSALGHLILDTVAKAIDQPALELLGYTEQWQARKLSNVSVPPVVFQSIIVLTGVLAVCIFTNHQSVCQSNAKR